MKKSVENHITRSTFYLKLHWRVSSPDFALSEVNANVRKLLSSSMKPKLLQALLFCAVSLGIGVFVSPAAPPAKSADTAPIKGADAIPWSQLGGRPAQVTKTMAWRCFPP